MSTFCRITGRSRGLPKPNYFPLLPPISPADAKRFCRITGKSYGLPAHHYIPVLVTTKPKKKAAQAPIPIEGQQNGIPTKNHVLVADYRYVFPVCGDSADLVQLLDSKDIKSKAHYIYKVDERRCSLVFNAKMEAAVRDGDIKNVMLAKDSDTLLLKLKRGGDVAIDVKELSIENLEIYDGEGPSEEVVSQRNKRKRTGSTVLSTLGKIFKDKERAADIDEERETQKAKLLKKNNIKKARLESKPQKWYDIKPDPINSIVPVSSQDLGILFENNNWSNWDITLQHRGQPTANKMPPPCVLEPQVVDLGTSLPGLIQAPLVLDNTIGLEVATALSPISPLIVEPDEQLQQSIKALDQSDIEQTFHIKEVFTRDKHNLSLLPTIEEIPELIERIKQGTHSTVNSSYNEVSGLKIDVNSASKFIVGISVNTPSGPIFVPGHTIHTANGEQFVPGITIKSHEGVPQLLPGQIFEVDKDNSGGKQSVFIAGQVLNTREGEKFVPGQILETKEGMKFVPGQTIISEDCLKFVPGQIVLGDSPQNSKFVPGLTDLDCEGHKFVPGQMYTDQYGQINFIPGQCELSEEGWRFIPGQNLVAPNGELKFVPGQIVESKDGPSFIPGQSVKNKFGEHAFVPGVVVENEKGAKFVPGASIKTPEGQKFVEGQLFRSGSGKMHFIPGNTDIAEQGEYEFSVARNISDIVYRDSISLGISLENAAINTADKADSIYGHIVQTGQGVEFFPGVASGLPSGKVVPGKLTRGKEVKFVPGLMIDGKFVPGQVVSTEQGEHFVPGQVVETKDGAKFVPGQVIETRSGPKFVPGQTVETSEGPKFVPGQIVDTKAGPTFIPGQVISTDNEGSRFVPGQVVETIEGPRFVPGRVIETGDKVTFVPGQVVETTEGLRFVAPDLENNPEGDVQFTVQGFEITPEELGLLQTHIGSNSIFAESGETAIDSRMMKQLSEAGMAVGRQVPADIPVVDVRTVPAMGVACSLRDRLPGRIDPVTTIKLSQILASVADFDCTTPINGSEIVDHAREGIILKAMMKAAAMADNELVLYRNVCTVLEKVLLSEGKEEIVPIIDILHKFITTSTALDPLRPKKKMVILKDVIVGNVRDDRDIIERLSYILNDSDNSIIEGFKNFTKGHPEIVGKIVQRMTDTLDKIETEKDATEALQKAIRDVVRESSEISVQDVLHNASSENVKNMFLEAIGLARAMGMRDVANTLLGAIADPKKAELLVNDRITFEILRRLTVMRHLAEERPKFGTALLQLKIDPEEARADPLVRELVRESGALMIVPEDNAKIQSSGDVPLSLLSTTNSLAMEDFLLKNRKLGILVIVKHGMQCVIPREASRAVLTGKVPYTVLDEKGMHTFAPLHVFAALHIPKMYTHRFSMYSATMEEEAPTTLGTLTPTSARSASSEEMRSAPSKDPVSEEGGDVIFTASQDYLPNNLDSLSLHRGEQVIVLETTGGNVDHAKRLELDPELCLGGEVGSLLDSSAARHKLSVRPRKKHTSRHRDTSPNVPDKKERWFVQSIEDPMRQGWVPASLLSSHEDSPDVIRPNDAKFSRDVVIRELIETEEEFGRDVQQVIEAYLQPLDSSSVPRAVRDNKDLIFGNLKKISEFHNTTLIEGLRYYAEEPHMLGKTFLRLERDFDKHVTYCRDEPAAQEFLMYNEVAREFFEVSAVNQLNSRQGVTITDIIQHLWKIYGYHFDNYNKALRNAVGKGLLEVKNYSFFRALFNHAKYIDERKKMGNIFSMILLIIKIVRTIILRWRMWKQRRKGHSSKRRERLSSKRSEGPSSKRREGSSSKRGEGSSSKRREGSSSKRRGGSSSKRREGSSSKRRGGHSSKRRKSDTTSSKSNSIPMARHRKSTSLWDKGKKMGKVLGIILITMRIIRNVVLKLRLWKQRKEKPSSRKRKRLSSKRIKGDTGPSSNKRKRLSSKRRKGDTTSSKANSILMTRRKRCTSRRRSRSRRSRRHNSLNCMMLAPSCRRRRSTFHRRRLSLSRQSKKYKIKMLFEDTLLSEDDVKYPMLGRLRRRRKVPLRQSSRLTSVGNMKAARCRKKSGCHRRSRGRRHSTTET